MTTGFNCHECGLKLPEKGFVVWSRDDRLHRFCDNDCLSRWIRCVVYHALDEAKASFQILQHRDKRGGLG